MKYYLKCLQKYADLSGRASRREYWHFFGINFLITMILGVIARINPNAGLGMISLVYSIAVLLPGLSVGVRRFHDIGRSGMSFACYAVPIFICILLIPVVEWASIPINGVVNASNECMFILFGFAYFIVHLLPLILGVMLLIVLARRGEQEDNKYGAPPFER